MDFSGLVVLITGASRGIGLCLSQILHEYGATVVGIYNETPINTCEYDTYKCDLRNEEEIKNVIDLVIKKHENIDVLVNCAATSLDSDIYDKTKEEFMNVLEVNLVGTFLMCKYVSKYMNSGIIINVASTDGEDTYSPISMDYCTSKAGVINLTKNLALRFPKLKICAISPNWVNTESVLSMDGTYLEKEMERVQQKRLLKKEEVALKIIEIIINDDIRSGEIVRMDGNNE